MDLEQAKAIMLPHLTEKCIEWEKLGITGPQIFGVLSEHLAHVGLVVGGNNPAPMIDTFRKLADHFEGQITPPPGGGH